MYTYMYKYTRPHCDLTGIMIIILKRNHPQMALIQVSEILYFTHVYMYIYIYIYNYLENTILYIHQPAKQIFCRMSKIGHDFPFQVIIAVKWTSDGLFAN